MTNTYNSKQIAKELQATAQGEAFYGNALYVALDHPVTTQNDKQMLHRYMHGAELKSDRVRLQELVIELNNYAE